MIHVYIPPKIQVGKINVSIRGVPNGFLNQRGNRSEITPRYLRLFNSYSSLILHTCSETSKYIHAAIDNTHARTRTHTWTHVHTHTKSVMEIGHAHKFQIQYHQYNMVQHEIGSNKQKKGNSMIAPLYVRMEHSCVVRYGNVTQIVLFSWSQIFMLNQWLWFRGGRNCVIDSFHVLKRFAARITRLICDNQIITCYNLRLWDSC